MLALAAVLLAGTVPQDDLAKTIDDLIARCSDDRVEVRDEAAQALADLGPAAVPILQVRLARIECEVRGRVEAALRQIQARMSMEKFLPPLRAVTLEIEDRPVREALEAVAARTGLPLEYSNCSVEDRISLSLREVPPLQALDEICRRAGSLSYQARWEHRQGPQVPGSETTPLHFQNAAFTDYPRCYVRHYRVQVTHLSLTKTQDFRNERASGMLQLSLGWPPDVRPGALREIRIRELRDDRGRSLLKEDPADRMAAMRHLHHLRHYGMAMTHSITFEYPETDARKIAALSGRMVLRFPKEIRTLTFEDPSRDRGKTVELAGYRITLKDYAVGEPQHTVRLEVVRAGGAPDSEGAGLDGFSEFPVELQYLEVISADGKPMRNAGSSSSWDGRKRDMSLEFLPAAPGPAKEIRLSLPLGHFEDEAEFEIRDIPLPK